MQTYGQSVVNLLTSLVESHEVCAKIGLCHADQHSGFVQMTDEDGEFFPAFV
jgi:Saposin-like type B, region 2